MLTNYFKIAYRNLLKNKIFSLINILGLTIGMAACLWWMFGLAGLMAVLTVSLQTIKVALANPVKSLRYE